MDTILGKVLRTFIMTLLIATIGMMLGQYVPEQLFIPLMVFELIILIAVVFLRRSGNFGYGFLFFFVFLTGVTIYPAIDHYVTFLGGNVVITIFFSTLVIFTILAVVGTLMKTDLMNLRGMLLATLVGLITVSLINIFFPLGTLGQWVITLVGILVFSIYTIYDFNQIQKRDFTKKDVPRVTLGIYLDFINLFLDLLRLVGLLSRD